MKVVRALIFATIVAALLVGCGGHSRKLSDGEWYGKLVSVDVAHRRLNFVPVCNLNPAGRWVAATVSTHRVTIALVRNPDLQIYFRPGGDASAGHGQPADLRLLADAAAHGRLPDSPPGWFVALRGGEAVSVEEDSGLRSSGKIDKRTFACVWSKRTQALVSP